MVVAVTTNNVKDASAGWNLLLATYCTDVRTVSYVGLVFEHSSVHSNSVANLLGGPLPTNYAPNSAIASFSLVNTGAPNKIAHCTTTNQRWQSFGLYSTQTFEIV
jgi:hypothetical protein